MNSITVAPIESLTIGSYDEALVAKFVEQIKNDGDLPPIEISPDNIVIKGAETVVAAKQLGFSTLAAIVTGGVNPPLESEPDENAIALLSDEELINQVNAEADLAFNAAGEALKRARRAGMILLEQRRRTKRGGWLPWLKANCPRISERTAQEWCQIARDWDEIQKGAAERGLDLGNLTQSSALKLLRGTSEATDDSTSKPPKQTEAEPQQSAAPAPMPTVEDVYAAFSSHLHSLPPRRVVATVKQVSETFSSDRLSSLDRRDLEDLIHSSSCLIRQAKAALGGR
jgi:hypothetical protein